jgi:hypothetical protein
LAKRGVYGTWSTGHSSGTNSENTPLLRSVSSRCESAAASAQITASDPGDKAMYFDPAEDKVYRHPTFYKLPTEVDHM